MNDSNSWSHIHCNTYHTCNMMQMAFSKAFGSVQWINPDDHVFFIELIWKLIEVPISVSWAFTVYFLHLFQILSVSNFVYFVIF
jgi:hypothetical protein